MLRVERNNVNRKIPSGPLNYLRRSESTRANFHETIFAEMFIFGHLLFASKRDIVGA